MAGNQSFSAQVTEWAQAEMARAEAVYQTAALIVANEVREPGPSAATTKKAIAGGIGKGRGKVNRQGPIPNPGGTGRMPIDTGNLRRSLMASTTAMPAIKPGKETYSESGFEMIIQGAPLGGVVYLGFQAAYAARMEYGFVGTDKLGRTYNQAGYGFVAATAQRWPQIVAEAEATVRDRFEAGPNPRT